jgi:hypothetical protein
MTSFFKGVALLVALCCLVWVGMLWHWQNTQHDMSVRDVVVYLGALPLTLFALVLLGGWAWRGASAKAATQDAPPAGTAPAAQAAPSQDEAARHASWQLLAAHGHTAIGATPAEWLEAAEAQKPAPALDAELRDVAGLPVISARVADVDLAALTDELDTLLHSLQPQYPQLQVSPVLRRALALLREPLAACIAGLAPWAEPLSVAAPRRATSDAAPSTLAESRIGVLAAWPEGLNALEMELAQRWLIAQCKQAGVGVVEPERWTWVPAGNDAALSGPRLWLRADAWFEVQRREQRQHPLLLVATHSDIDAEALARLQNGGGVGLFSASRPKGTIPGEAAAVLLLAPASWPADPRAEAPKPHLHRAAVAQRDKSIDASGRLTHTLAPQLIAQALAAAQLAQADIGAIANDADQHSARGAELFAAMLAELPQLDATDDMRMIGQLCGNIGACATLMTAAMAAQQAVTADKPCLALSLRDAQWRAALVARPTAPPSPAQASSAPAEPR